MLGEYLYSEFVYDNQDIIWKPHRITKITNKYVYVLRSGYGLRVRRIPRQILEYQGQYRVNGGWEEIYKVMPGVRGIVYFGDDEDLPPGWPPAPKRYLSIDD